MVIFTITTTTLWVLLKLLALLYVEMGTGEFNLEASPADGHPEHEGGRGRQTDPHQGLRSPPYGSHWAIPPAQHTSCQQASNVREATER